MGDKSANLCSVARTSIRKRCQHLRSGDMRQSGYLLVVVGLFHLYIQHDQLNDIDFYLLLRRKAERAKFVLQVLQLRIELLLLSVEVIEDLVHITTISTNGHLSTPHLLLLLLLNLHN